jgi:hypothetical protein
LRDARDNESRQSYCYCQQLAIRHDRTPVSVRKQIGMRNDFRREIAERRILGVVVESAFVPVQAERQPQILRLFAPRTLLRMTALDKLALLRW